MKARAVKVKVTNIEIDGADGKIPARVLTPSGAGPFPIIVYFHGGGWVVADNTVYEASMHALVDATGAVLVPPEYRKAPEHKFPAAHDAAVAAYQWIIKNAAALKGDTKRIAVVGESAGGNLVANVAIAARDQHLVMPLYQVLIYPVTGVDMTTPSYVQNADAMPLNKAMIAWSAKNTFDLAQGKDPRITLTDQESLAGLPPATIITSDIDPLRDDGARYAKALQAAGMKVDYTNYEGVTHEFFGMGAVVKKAAAAEMRASGPLVDVFETPATR